LSSIGWDGTPARLAVTLGTEIVVASINGRDRFCLHATNVEKTIAWVFAVLVQRNALVEANVRAVPRPSSVIAKVVAA
jgi:hypothetical protein